MKILHFSDIHGEGKYIDLAAEIIKNSDIIVITGDISKHGNPGSAQNIISAIQKYNKNVLAVHGNWDVEGVMDILNNCKCNIHSSGKIINGIGFFGLGGSSPTPMKTPTEYSEDEIYDYLNTGFNMVKNSFVKVLLSHAPPYKTTDRTFLGMQGGSKSVRKFIEENHIDLCLSGHIHESSGVKILNSCIVANPGSFKKGKYISIEIKSDRNICAEDIKLEKL